MPFGEKAPIIQRTTDCAALGSAASWVDNIRPFVQRASAHVVPLRTGRGARINTYEAMAMSKAVFSTRIAREGLPVAHSENILLLKLDWTRQTGLRFRQMES